MSIAHPTFSFLLGTLAALFPIADPIGAIPIFCTLTAKHSSKCRRQEARQIALNVFAVLVTFFLVGKFILSFFGISLAVVRIAGGLIVAHTAWQMVTSHQRLTLQEHAEAIDKEDITFTPMAVPLISGPGAIGVTMTLSTRCQVWEEYLGCLLGIGLFGGVVYVCLALGERLLQKWGKTGVGALTRILGFFILAIAVQLIADGSLEFVRANLYQTR
ncbi:MAG: NAAT family transporter [Thermosynechococcus sp. Uc]|uniref:MarC family protein n=1 Tax=Thermosynechococcus sp. Uc TaxID=3034853 RepID=UPI001A01D6B4|nr:NAAT family transporter [Thermosynechococcus sp. Uc]MDM7326546.1 NAAT family transporter [Thermosynechococcus sp. Uc]HIK25232.1 NAAT family transporter [Thermosynechococcus sp. M46_R2017_013]